MVERRVTHAVELPFPDQRKHHEPSMIELLTFINHQIGDMRKELTDHMRDETSELAKTVASMMHEAFPGGDPSGHRKHHEAVIKKAEASAAFWEDMAKSASRWGIFGFMGWLLYVAWAAFVKGPQ